MWRWIFTYDQLFADLTNPNYVYSELETLLGFCLARRAQIDDFLLEDLTNNFVGPALNPADNSPNLQARLQIVNDGVTYSPRIQRNFGGQFFEDITDLGPGGITVYANGSADGPAW